MNRSRSSRRLASLMVCLSLGACGSDGKAIPSDRLAGECTVGEPGAGSLAGTAAYVEHVTPSAGGGFGPGSLGVSITCITRGSEPDHVVLILPNLERGQRPPLGTYRIRSPADATLTPSDLTDARLAWARVRRGGAVPILFTGEAGRITITRAEDGFLEGAYEVALGVADSSVALPGARPEVGGPLATDSLDRPVVGRTVLGGAFVAPRGEADWRGR